MLQVKLSYVMIVLSTLNYESSRHHQSAVYSLYMYAHKTGKAFSRYVPLSSKAHQ